MLQSSIFNIVNLKLLDYKYINSFGKTVTLNRTSLTGFLGFEDSKAESFNSSIIYNSNSPLAVVNVNCKNPKDMDKIFKACEVYSKEEDPHYVKSRIVAGRFPREVDTNLFCDMFDLDDVSTLVGQESHSKNNRERLNHLFISRNLEVNEVHKLVGWTEVLNLGEAYPIEASISYKKVLK